MSGKRGRGSDRRWRLGDVKWKGDTEGIHANYKLTRTSFTTERHIIYLLQKVYVTTKTKALIVCKHEFIHYSR